MAAQKNVEIVQNTIITRVPQELVDFFDKKKLQKQKKYNKLGIKKKVTRTIVALEFMNSYIALQKIEEVEE